MEQSRVHFRVMIVVHQLAQFLTCSRDFVRIFLSFFFFSKRTKKYYASFSLELYFEKTQNYNKVTKALTESTHILEEEDVTECHIQFYKLKEFIKTHSTKGLSIRSLRKSYLEKVWTSATLMDSKKNYT